jgi:hypothetical protein
MAGQVPARMTVSRVFLRIAFRGARFEALERDPASARESFQRRFRGSNRAMVSLCSVCACSPNRIFWLVRRISFF